MSRRLPFTRLLELEPRLGELLKEAQAVRDDGTGDYFCANQAFFAWGERAPGFKARLIRLVGWWLEGGHPDLATSEAYDTAHRAIYDALPPCRGRCGCFQLEEDLAPFLRKRELERATRR